MATFAQLGSIATSDDFQKRVAYALSVGATNVYSELNTVTGHAARALYAVKVANGDYNLASAALMVLGNAAIAAEATVGVTGNTIPDADIQFSVNSLWNVLAGA